MSDDIDSEQILFVYAQLDRLLDHERSLSVFAGLTAVAVEHVPGVQFASITRGRKDHFQTLAPTALEASEADRLQYELNSGPCVDALAEGRPMRIDDLGDDGRWPVFGPQAAKRFGVASMLSIQLLVNEEVRASLNMYSRERRAFSAAAQNIGMLLAAHGAVILGSALARERVVNMEKALGNSRRIGMAIGVLMSARRITADQAFTLLRVASQNSNRRIAVVADGVVETGELAMASTAGSMGPPATTGPTGPVGTDGGSGNVVLLDPLDRPDASVKD